MADLDLFSGIHGIGPGGGAEEQTTEHKKRWSLRQETELRFEIDQTELVVMKLLSGTAELFGSELPRGVEVVFQQGGSGAIFTWHGCDLEVSGQPSHIYVESDTTMKQTCAVHGVLDARRARARAAGGAGPRVLIAGPADSGKSTVTRLLLAYAARMQWAPTLVDLDLGAGFIGVPGTIGACSLRAPLELRGDFGGEGEAVLQYFYGMLLPHSSHCSHCSHAPNIRSHSNEINVHRFYRRCA